jgi:endonuclease YncB( thermonuclease family)
VARFEGKGTMRKPLFAAAVGLAALAGFAPPPAEAAGTRIFVRLGAVPLHPHLHRGHFAERHDLHGHRIPAHRLRAHDSGGLHVKPGFAVVHPVKPAHRVLVFVPLVTHVATVPRIRYVAPLAYGAALPPPQVLASPAYAIDGDTFDAAGVRYRLNGIDTPELYEPLGPQARERLQQLLALGPVTVYPVARDVYGWIVADVVVGGLNLAQVLRAEGFAKN